MRAHGLGPQRSAAAYGPPRWATKATYDCRNDRWDEERVQVRIEDTHFAEGGMRFAYRALELSDDGSESEAVVKAFPRSHLATDPNACANEAMTQMVAESYAQVSVRKTPRAHECVLFMRTMHHSCTATTPWFQDLTLGQI